MCLCVYVWVYLGQTLIDFKSFPQFLFTLQIEAVSHLNSEQNDPDSLASQLTPSPEPWGYKQAIRFTWVLGIWSLGLKLTWQAFNLPSYSLASLFHLHNKTPAWWNTQWCVDNTSIRLTYIEHKKKVQEGTKDDRYGGHAAEVRRYNELRRTCLIQSSPATQIKSQFQLSIKWKEMENFGFSGSLSCSVLICHLWIKWYR